MSMLAFTLASWQTGSCQDNHVEEAEWSKRDSFRRQPDSVTTTARQPPEVVAIALET